MFLRWVPRGGRKRLIQYAGRSRLDELKFVDLVSCSCVRACVRARACTRTSLYATCLGPTAHETLTPAPCARCKQNTKRVKRRGHIVAGSSRRYSSGNSARSKLPSALDLPLPLSPHPAVTSQCQCLLRDRSRSHVLEARVRGAEAVEVKVGR